MIPLHNKKKHDWTYKKFGIKHTSIEIINQQSNVFNQ